MLTTAEVANYRRDGFLTGKRLLSDAETAAFREAWERRDAIAGLRVTVHRAAETLEGVAKGVDDSGALLLEAGKQVKRVLTGDVSLRAIEISR